MIKKFSLIIYKFLYLIENILYKLVKKRFLIYLNDFIQENSYTFKKILNKKIKFFVHNHIALWRVETLFTKEPETLEWINEFENNEKIIFWDIGANIGLYSIYTSIKHKNATTIAFEPSTSNLRLLSRNISINNLENKIMILPLPLTNSGNIFQVMHEGDFIEGRALNSFGQKFDFEGKRFKSKMNYSILGSTINNLIFNKTLDIPDYIKIDVDGIEHLILEGGDKILNNKKIKSISIEVNENFSSQYSKVLELMSKYKFRIKHKKRNEKFYVGQDFNKTFNYVFIR